MKTHSKALSFLLISFLILMISAIAMAQPRAMPERERDTTGPCEPRAYLFADHRWFFDLGLTLWPAATMGDVTLQGETTEMDVSIASALQNFDLAAGVQAEVGWCRISLLVDFFFQDIATDQITAPQPGTAQQDLTQISTTTVLSWLFQPHELLTLGPVAGVRYLNIASGLEIEEGINVTAREGFFDPIVGLRGKVETPIPLYVPLYADVGGLGFGSNLTWQAFAGVGVEIHRVNLELGYRHLYVNYEGDQLELDLHTFGPQLGLRFRF